MRLNRLELFGFKSFAQKVEIPFGPGITAIVGPNGCGKSNVVEAIRWVLGEQRAGAFRSHRMEEVIFAGSRQRKPLGMSEVALTINNADHTLPIDFSEITLARRLFRSGESDYLLNKVPCRLLDIHNLLMDTGLGQGSYAVMEQGMVDEIVSEKTENRRRILEEAAGITKYKTRRRSTWSKLEATQADLARIEDLLAEKKRLVDYLGKQVGRARRYQDQKDELDTLEKLLGRYHFFAIQAELLPLREETEILHRDSQSGYTRFRALETKLENLRLGYTDSEKVMQTVSLELNKYNDKIHEKDRERITLRERIESAERDTERAEQERVSLTEQHNESQRQRISTGEELEAAIVELAAMGQRLENDAEAAAEAERSYNASRNELNDAQRLQLDLLHRSAELDRTRERLRTERDNTADRTAALQQETDQVDSNLQAVLKVASAAATNLKDLQRHLSVAGAKHQALEQSMQESETELRRREQCRDNLRRIVDAENARLKVMEKVRLGYGDYSSGVRNLMLKSPCADNLKGVVGDLVEADTFYHKAVEAALGEALQALVATDRDSAMAAMDHLITNGGRAGIFPLTWHARPLPAPVQLPSCPGLLGPLRNFCRTESPFANLIQRLLTNVFLVEDLKIAAELAANHLGSQLRFVTLKGDSVDTDGLIAGGRPSSEVDSIIGRRREIASIRHTAAKKQGRLETAITTCQGEDLRQSTLAKNRKRLYIDLAELREREREQDHRRQLAEKESQQLKSRLSQLSEAREQLDQRHTQVSNTLANSNAQLQSAEEDKRRLEETIGLSTARLTEAERTRNQQRDALATMRIDQARVTEHVKSLKRDSENLARIGNSQGQNMDRLVSEITQTQQNKDRCKAREHEVHNELQKMHGVREKLQLNRDDKQQTWQHAMVQTREKEGIWRRMQTELNTQRERQHELELQISELVSRANNLREHLQADYRCNVEALGGVPNDADFEIGRDQQRADDLKQSLARLGSVHVGVLEEHEQEKENFEFLRQQRDDLMVSADDLRKMLSIVDRTARRMFKETFAEIRTKFKETYGRFFNGGEADLILEENSDPLEGAIDIVARPSGKRLQNITLLSGGERALTAISLLFAIYQVKPSPFCILDEVDAPLDDTNVGRFVRVLKEFARNTQFIMVTHNKLSMHAADTMHGVTMPEEGVSQLVSVQVDEELDAAAG